MKWNNADIEKYLSAKEYVDTAILPIQPMHISNESRLAQDALNNELINIYASEIEKELSGRVFLFPTYYYLPDADLDLEKARVEAWVSEIQTQPFENVFLFTFDAAWKKRERDLKSELIWLPGMKVGDIHSEEVGRLIRTQVEQISELIRAYW